MEPVFNYLEQNAEQSVERLKEYLRFPSVSAQPDRHAVDIEECANWIGNRFQETGLKVDKHLTKGSPIIVAKTPEPEDPKAPKFIVYGHYDVQPPEPFDLWNTKPFEPTVVGDKLFARGASDNKGQHYAHAEAVAAYIATDTALPCQVIFLIEGEEEVGSESLVTFLAEHKEELQCDAVIISDNGIPDLDHPVLTYGLRGVAALEVHVEGPDRDLHSGIFGGAVENPAMALARLLASCRDEDGRVLVEGFYDDVEDLTDFERNQLSKWPESEETLRKNLGVPKLFGEVGFSAMERRSARPTLEINGLTSGYQGTGSKTIVPSVASAKLTARLVPNQDPAVVVRQIESHLRNRCPDTVRLRVEVGHAGEPYAASPEGPVAEAALEALRQAFDREPIAAREGGSIPIVNNFKKVLGVDTVLLGLGLPDDNIHSPNEKFDLNAFRIGKRLSATLWPLLASKIQGAP